MSTELTHIQEELADLAEWFKRRGMDRNADLMVNVACRLSLRGYADSLTQDELRTLRAISNGKLGKRVITPEQQTKMQESRKTGSKRRD